MTRCRLAAGTAALLAVAGCGGSGPKAATASPAPKQSYTAEPPLTIARTGYTATIRTTAGTISVALNGATAPHTVNSFAFLAGRHFFDGTTCHRLTTRGIFVLQCGDPTGTGSGGPGYTIPDENLRGATYPAGTIAMANTGQPHTGGSQFFLVYRNTDLPPQYTPFGTVTAGLDVLRRIAAAGTDNANGDGDGHPRTHVVIESFRVAKS